MNSGCVTTLQPPWRCAKLVLVLVFLGKVGKFRDMASIDRYSETALGNRDYFLKRPQSIRGPGTSASFFKRFFRRLTSANTLMRSASPTCLLLLLA
jgi:hypothetical protein